jgi:hypothetical protein
MSHIECYVKGLGEKTGVRVNCRSMKRFVF